MEMRIVRVCTSHQGVCMDGLARVSGIGFIKRLLGSQEQPRASTHLARARMLVVDDSPTICAVLGKMLRERRLRGRECDRWQSPPLRWPGTTCRR